MTRNQLRLACRRLNITVRERDGEIRINYPGGKEATAYYTNDRKDALATAAQMAFRCPDPDCEDPTAPVGHGSCGFEG